MFLFLVSLLFSLPPAHARRRQLLSFSSSSYKTTVTVTNRCDNDSGIYFINGRKAGCPDDWYFFEYADICSVVVPARSTLTFDVNEYGYFSFFENFQ
jgi:hypothetical protein